ncbi:MAG: hypothetical protein EBU59_02830 [Planctomycetia bacterium]|nr:hypothetical protein [Planctomycetia bacterium]
MPAGSWPDHSLGAWAKTSARPLSCFLKEQSPSRTPCFAKRRFVCQKTDRYYDLEADDIVGSSQRRCHVRPRGLAIHCAHLLTGKSSHAIGRAIGGRDHTTILHSLKVSTNLMQHDSGYAGDFAAMIEHLTGQPPRRS